MMMPKNFIGTPEQFEDRQHRIAYMVQDGDVSEEQAEKYCDEHPFQYGLRETKQGGLF